MLFLVFKYSVSHYDTPYTIGVATRASASDSWTTVWSKSPSGDIDPTELNIKITNTDLGSATFQFCFYFSGKSYNINYWWIDNVMLFEPYATDARLTKNTVPLYIAQGNTNITGTLNNYGWANINDFTINYRVDSGVNPGTPHATVISGVNIVPGGNYNFTCTPPWNISTAGNYKVIEWISDVNSSGKDSCNANDTISKVIGVATQTTTCRPVFEEFTSSTCSICVGFNSGTVTPFCNLYGSQFSLVKYQMDWPGNGDPYFTAEGGARQAFYKVTGVPALFVDGRPSGETSSSMLNELNADKAKATFFVISGLTPSYLGNTVTVPITVTPYVTGNLTLHVIVVEKKTTGNVGTNGETSFNNVMMKMITGGNGLAIDFVSGVPYSNTFSFDMTGTHVEEMTDLKVIVFIQENSTKEIYQSAESEIPLGIQNLTNDNISVFPNPAYNNVTIKNASGSTIALYDILGNQLIVKDNINDEFMLDISGLTQGNYVLKIINGDNASSRKITIMK